MDLSWASEYASKPSAWALDDPECPVAVPGGVKAGALRAPTPPAAWTPPLPRRRDGPLPQPELSRVAGSTRHYGQTS